MTKPFDNRELIARIKVVLRRYETSEQNSNNTMVPVRYKDLEIDFETKRVLMGGVPISLTAKELKILETLSKRPKKVFTRDELLELVWGYDYSGDNRSVDMTIMRLRKKLEDDTENSRYVKTIYGFGYQFGGEAN